MTPKMKSVLESIHRTLGEASATEAPTGAESHFSGSPGIKTADNVPDILDRFAVFIEGIIDSLCMQYGCTDSEALDCFIAAAAELAEQGMLPPIPDKADLAAVAAWQGKAVTVQIGGYAAKGCYDKFGGVPTPDGRHLGMGGY